MQLKAENVSFRYRNNKMILEDFSLRLEGGERTALIAPSGHGKTTLAKLLAGYERPLTGQVTWAGQPLPERGYCPVQMIWQHPEQAVNPRWKMRQVLAETAAPEEAQLVKFGIEPEWLNRWPSELSGGELQRFCIARVLNEKTEYIIADEISAMFDVITQAQVWQLLLEEAARRKLGMLVITHNLELAKRTCSRILYLAEMPGAGGEEREE